MSARQGSTAAAIIGLGLASDHRRPCRARSGRDPQADELRPHLHQPEDGDRQDEDRQRDELVPRRVPALGRDQRRHEQRPVDRRRQVAAASRGRAIGEAMEASTGSSVLGGGIVLCSQVALRDAGRSPAGRDPQRASRAVATSNPVASASFGATCHDPRPADDRRQDDEGVDQLVGRQPGVEGGRDGLLPGEVRAVGRRQRADLDEGLADVVERAGAGSALPLTDERPRGRSRRRGSGGGGSPPGQPSRTISPAWAPSSPPRAIQRPRARQAHPQLLVIRPGARTGRGSSRPDLDRRLDRLGARRRPELPVQRLDLRPNRVRRHVQAVGHLGGGQVGRQEAQHADLGRGERRRPAGAGREAPDPFAQFGDLIGRGARAAGAGRGCRPPAGGRIAPRRDPRARGASARPR